jgi:oxaloacetate decarboxylase alpha subunit
VNAELQARVLEGDAPITCRPADLLEPEMDALAEELTGLAEEQGIRLEGGERRTDDVLTYALFPQVGLRFLANRGNAEAFEPHPDAEAAGEAAGKAPAPVAAPAAPAAAPGGPAVYTVKVDGQPFVVEVSEGGEVASVAASPASGAAPAAAPAASDGDPLPAPLAGNIVRVAVAAGDPVSAGDVVLTLEAMKMETEVRAPRDGTVVSVAVAAGDAVHVGDTLLVLG